MLVQPNKEFRNQTPWVCGIKYFHDIAYDFHVIVKYERHVKAAQIW